MRWRRIAVWSGLGLLALIVLAISWLWTADLGSFKPHIERWASEKTGRQISIDGDLHIDLARHSVVIAENIRIQNAAWSEPADMITVGRIEVRLDLRSIFNGPILVELIDLDDAEIFLTRPPDGDPNWMLKEPQEKEEKSSDKLEILFRQIDIDRVHLVYTSPQRTEPIDLFVEHFEQQHGDDDFLELSLAATVGDRQVKLEGKIGTWAALLRGEDVQYDFAVQLDTFEIVSTGRIDDLTKPRRPSLNFTARGPDIDDLTRLLKMGEEGSGDINLSGSLRPVPQGPLVLDIKGNIGRTEIEASGAFSDLQDLEDIDIELLASGPDIRPILNLFGIDQIRESPFMVNVDAKRRGSSLIVEKAKVIFGEAQFDLTANVPNFPSADDSIINLRIEGPDIERFRYVFGLPGEATGAFSVDFIIDVADDGVEILNLDVQTSLARIKANGQLGQGPDYFGSTLKFQLNSDSLARIGSAYGLRTLPDRPIEIVGDVEWTQDGIRTIDSLQAPVDKLTFRVDGVVKPAGGALGSDIEFGLMGPNLAELISAFGSGQGVPAQPYSLDGQLQVRSDGYRFRNITGSIGSTDLQIDGLLVPRPGMTGSRFDFEISGPAFEEVIGPIGELEVRHGPYELSGSVLFKPDTIDFDDIELDRPGGKLNVDLELGVPVSRRWVNLDIQAKGPDVRTLIRGLENFEPDEAPFLIDVRGTIRDTTLAFDRLDINVGDATLSAHGALEFVDDATASEFQLNINIPSLAILGEFNGYRMREQGFTLAANVASADGVLAIDNLVATLGESDINGKVRYRTGDVPQLDVSIKSDSIVFAPLLEEREQEYDPEPEFEDGRLIPDMPIPFEAMREFGVSVDIDIGELQRDSLYVRDLRLHAELHDGILDVPVVGFRARSGAVVGKARIAPGDSGEGIASIELVARNFALGVGELNQDLAMTGDIDIKLESTGADLRTLLGNANGIFYMNTRGGRFASNKSMHAIYGDMLNEILTTINPFRQSNPYTSFTCVIVPMEIVNGVVSGAPGMLVSTDKVHMALKYVVDLKSEGIEINIRTTPKTGIGISAGDLVNPYIKVVGTLAAPRMAVDEKGVLLTGGAAVATGGLTLLARAAWDRLKRSEDRCSIIAEQAVEILSDRFPDLEPAMLPAEASTEE